MVISRDTQTLYTRYIWSFDMTKFLFKSQISYLTLFCWCWKSKNIMRYYIRILEQFRPNNLQCPSTANNRVVRMASFDICIFFCNEQNGRRKELKCTKAKTRKTLHWYPGWPTNLPTIAGDQMEPIQNGVNMQYVHMSMETKRIYKISTTEKKQTHT